LLRIRLSRVGKKKQPAYRIVVADSRSPRDGSFLKIIGHYNPLTDPATLVVKEDEAVRWLEKGAKPSDTAAKLLTRIGVMERAGRPPMRYEGKAVPPGPKKEATVVAAPAVAEPKAAPAATAAKPEEEAPEPAAEPEQAEATTGATEAEAEAETPAAEPAAEAPEAKGEAEAGSSAASASDPAAGDEIETKEVEAETEPEATNEEQSQEPAETQE